MRSNLSDLEFVGASSNEIRVFSYEGRKYIVKTPLMKGDRMSPFWHMMQDLFGFSITKQVRTTGELCALLDKNPHLKTARFVAADEEALLYEWEEGESRDDDEFPNGEDNAFILGQYVGYNHRQAYDRYGMLGEWCERPFMEKVYQHIEDVIAQYWNEDTDLDRKVRRFYERIKSREYHLGKYALIMVDMCADQFLYKDEELFRCVDLDAYVIGPVEWELCFLNKQIEDWERFREGYETYQSLPDFTAQSELFYYLMALNSVYDKSEIEEYWSKYIELD